MLGGDFEIILRARNHLQGQPGIFRDRGIIGEFNPSLSRRSLAVSPENIVMAEALGVSCRPTSSTAHRAWRTRRAAYRPLRPSIHNRHRPAPGSAFAQTPYGTWALSPLSRPWR